MSIKHKCVLVVCFGLVYILFSYVMWLIIGIEFNSDMVVGTIVGYAGCMFTFGK